MAKHKKIAITLHVINGLMLIAFGFILFVISQAFVACSTTALSEDPSICVYALSIFLGIPSVLALLPIVALIKFGKTSRGFLWAYSILIAVLFFPIGTPIGGHTIYLLRLTARGIYPATQ